MSGVAAEVRSRANGRSFDVDSAADPIAEGASGGQCSVREPESFRALGGKKEREMRLAISGGKGAPRAKKTTD